MQLPKGNLLVFEDSSTGVAAASAAGLKCVMVPDLKQPTKLDKDKATLICKDFYAFLEKLNSFFVISIKGVIDIYEKRRTIANRC